MSSRRVASIHFYSIETDISSGLYMHGAIMAALYARAKTGEGQKIDGSLFETQVALLTNVALSWLNLGLEAERWGAQHPSGSCSVSYELRLLCC